ncbi:DUF1553 domain-containing protein [Pirellulaceae bacterium SH467]
MLHHFVSSKASSWVIGLLWIPFLSAPSLAEGMIQYNRDIRPILTENCFACHGPDANKRAADLRLDVRDQAIAGGALVPQSADESELWKRIISTDADSVMPPPESHKSLTEKQKELLRQWISEGAEYQSHWAFIPPKKPELPHVRNGGWVRNPIDRFILAELERRGMEPSPEADMRSLIRRVCYDLTGLPPTPEEIKSVLEDPSPDRYENYVDQLLKRPEWGEHRGRYWLDYARYADTHGIHFDNFREMWSYREWVINAFNRNLPFDQFTIEQLAGDLLPNADLDQRIATGFNRCNITTNEGGIIDEEYRVLYTRDRVETTGQVWLGLTVGCAVCHDHKFDPISQAEFYQMAAFFNNTTQAVRDGNIKDTPPIVPVPLAEDRARAAELEGLIAKSNESIQTRKDAAKVPFEKYLTDPATTSELAWPSLGVSGAPETHVPFVASEARWLESVHQGVYRRTPLSQDATLAAGYIGPKAWEVRDVFPSLPVGDLERDQPFTVALWVKPTNNQNGSLIARMDEANGHRGWDIWTENGTVGMHLIHKWPEDALKAVSKPKLPANRWSHVAVSYDGSSKIEGLKIYINGSEVDRTVQSKTLTATTRTEVPLTIGRRHTSAPADKAVIQDIRIYRSVVPADAIAELKSKSRRDFLLAKSERSDAEKEELFTHYLATRDEESIRLNAERNQLVAEQNAIRQRGTIAHVMHEADSAPMAFVLTRGDYDKRGTEVQPAIPAVLPPMAEGLPKNRLGFAKWLLQPDHPLTARVTVNRFWQEVFGNGLVPSAGDFGITGQLPTHPELLDYLAVHFQEDGWNIRNYFRSIVTSSTYRQTASVSPEKLARDPSNKLLARGPRFRMDAEMIRDTALATSGLLVSKIGGPSVKPYQPPGVWEAVAMPESNTRNYVADKGEGLYRRSIYTFLKRAAPPANMEVFNATAREVCTIRRERTNTPLQALVTLNDTQFVEAARVLANRVLKEPGAGAEVSSRVQWIAERLVGRPLRAEEVQVVQGSYQELSSFYQSNPELATQLLQVGESKNEESIPPAELAAWTMLCNELMNLDEVITK